MNFFQAQDRARHNTTLLVLLFVLAVVCLVVGAYVALHFVQNFSAANNPQQAPRAFLPINWDVFFQVAGGVLGVVVFGSLFKILALSGGGAAVAESMGGQILLPDTRDGDERRLLNIVDEMALASGVPTPQVYVIPEEAINAFAAGTTLNNAVIGVTRGALRAFTRDEMQGVIAHEFSHILNGDMRLNIHLIGIIHGILLVGLLGYYCLRMSLYSSAGRSQKQNPLPIIGIILIIIGFVGTLFGNLIRSAISRQREFLADAAAVQFTRNPDGIAGALQKIGANAGILRTKSAAECAHMFFGPGVGMGFTNVFASHPPLDKRIRRILPNWDGTVKVAKNDSPEWANLLAGKPQVADPTAAAVASVADALSPSTNNWNRAFDGAASGFAGAGADAIGEQIGMITPAALQLSGAARQQLSGNLESALSDPYSARALIYTMLLDRHDESCRRAQLDHLQANADTGVYELVLRLAVDTHTMSRRACLPLVQRAAPALRRLSRAQYRLFMENLSAVIAADQMVELFEWCVQALVTHLLHDCFGGQRRVRGDKRAALSYALSLLARAAGDAGAEAAFQQAVEPLRITPTFSADAFEPQRLFNAMQCLSQTKPADKAAISKAMITCVMRYGRLDGEAEALLRAYLMFLDCPLPAAA